MRPAEGRTTERLLASGQRTLPPELQSASSARELVRRVLAEGQRSRWSDQAELAITEVVSNAALHAHTPMDVVVRVYTQHVRIEVADRSSLLPAPRAYDTRATTGRGLGLVALLTSSSGVEARDDGKAVWFVIDDQAGPDAEWGAGDDWALSEEWGLEIPTQHTPGTTVTLLQLPIPLWLAAQQHHEALLREYTLHEAGETGRLSEQLGAADQAETVLAGAVRGALEAAEAAGVPVTSLPEGHPSPLPETPARLDVTFQVPTEQAGGFAALQDVLDRAEKSARAGELLAKPALPEIIGVRDWCCDQIIAQLQGVGATPWNEEQHSHQAVVDQEDPVDYGWDATHVSTSERGVVAADDRNRIVAISPYLAEALGWAPEQLVGQRIVALIPPRLREMHVAGFTRHLTTGEAHVLGVPIQLPVLCADGREIMCDFMIERVPGSTKRSIYIAWIEPVKLEEENATLLEEV